MLVRSVLLLLCVASVHSQQNVLNYIGSNLGICFKVLNNVNGNDSYTDVSITLTNGGTQRIEPGPWEIYFYSSYKVEPFRISPNGVVVNGFNFTHVNGILFKFTPAGFNGLDNGESLEIKLAIQYWMISRTDIWPRWYVAMPGNYIPKLIESTIDVYNSAFVAPFSSPEQYRRYSYDQYAPFTPEQRYERYMKSDASAPPKQLVPTPIESTFPAGQSTTLDTTWEVDCGPYTDECNYFKEKFQLSGDSSSSSVVTLVSGDVNVPAGVYAEESYRLSVTSDAITITAPSAAGAFYGIQSLLSLASPVGNGWSVPQATITDAPRFEYRGMHLDVARNFVAKDDVITLLQTMAMYKMNNFHFHLTDDEGWRVYMKSYTELTNVGSKRAHDLSETESIIPQLGSGPTTTTSGSGHYTADDYRQILSEAAKLHIRVIPEVDLPGHAHAAIKSHMAAGRPVEDSLVDPNDKPTFESVQLFTDNAVNPCISGPYKFVKTVVNDFIALHEGIQPLTVFHLGGDEVAEAWDHSPRCEEIFDPQGFPNGTKDLLEYFVRNATAEILAANSSLKLGLWEDGALNADGPFDKTEITSNDILTYTWQNIWEWGNANRAYRLANAGYKVVISHATHLYFDQPYEGDPEERGLYWATRATEASKTFSHMPDNVYANVDVKRSGEPYTRNQMCSDFECTPLQPSARANILGMQCQLFSETIRSQENFHYMVFPRMLACAERAWHKANWEVEANNAVDTTKRNADWASFAAALSTKEFGRLSKMGIAFRLTPPGIGKSGDRLTIQCEYPNMAVQYRQGDESAWQMAKCGETHQFPIDSRIEFRTAYPATNPQRFSRSVFRNKALPTMASDTLITLLMAIFAYITVQL